MKRFAFAALVGALCASPLVASARPAAKKAKDPCGFCRGPRIDAPPAGLPGPENETRQKILQEAAALVDQVSDCGGSHGEKKGADVLEDLYKTGFGLDTLPAGWAPKIRKANGGQWKGPWSWCGVYAVAAAKKAGVDTHWGGLKKGEKPGPVGLKMVRGHKGLQPGDIFFIAAKNHHAIVERVDSKFVYSLDGNQYCSGIYRNKRPLSLVLGYYKPVDD